MKGLIQNEINWQVSTSIQVFRLALSTQVSLDSCIHHSNIVCWLEALSNPEISQQTQSSSFTPHSFAHREAFQRQILYPLGEVNHNIAIQFSFSDLVKQPVIIGRSGYRKRALEHKRTNSMREYANENTVSIYTIRIYTNCSCKPLTITSTGANLAIA